MANYSGSSGPDRYVGGEEPDGISGLDGDDVLSGAGGDDTVHGGSGDDALDGGAGNDRLDGGEHDDVLSGESGNDILNGGQGSDTLQGGEGDDRLDEYETGPVENADLLDGGEGADVIGADFDTALGGAGDDWIIVRNVSGADGGSGVDRLSVQLPALNPRLPPPPGFVVKDFTVDLRPMWAGGAGVITDGTLQRELRGFEQAYVSGGDGRDTLILGDVEGGRIFGGRGDDLIIGGVRADQLAGNEGADVISGLSGDDRLDGGLGDDLVEGGEGGDFISGGGGVDLLRGGDGADQIVGGGRLEGGAGDDLLQGDFANDFLVGGTGQDQLDGGLGADELHGDVGADQLNGSLGEDGLFGGEGDDHLSGGQGNDILDGGEGQDAAHFAGARRDYTIVQDADGYTVSGPDGVDRLRNVDRLHFGDAVVYLSTPGRVIEGGDAADTLKGGDGPDRLLGAGGADALVGGDGDDEVVGGSGDDQVSGGAGSDTLTGGEGDDTLDGGAGVDVARYSGPRSAYTVAPGANSLTVSGPEGTDTLTNINVIEFSDGLLEVTTPGQALTGTGGDDVLRGGDGGDRLQGDAGDDYLLGGDGDDLIVAGPGKDELLGGAGDDRIEGGLGADTIQGGAGHDWAMFQGALRSYGHQRGPDGGVTGILASDGFDRLYGIETLKFADGRWVFDSAHSSAQVHRLYLTFFAREADYGGFQNWVSQLEAGGTTVSAIADLFGASSEFQNVNGGLSNRDFVEAMYQRALGRTADPAGSDHWTAQLDLGTYSRSQLGLLFAESPEQIGRTQARVNQGFWIEDQATSAIARIYYTAFGRAPDGPGIAGLREFMEQSGTDPRGLVDSFTSSQEFTNLYGGLSTGQFVDKLYQVALGRPPDDAGRAHWINAIDNGGATKADMVWAFADSQEMRIKTAPLTEGGVQLLGGAGAPTADAAEADSLAAAPARVWLDESGDPPLDEGSFWAPEPWSPLVESWAA